MAQNTAANAGDVGSALGWERSPGEGTGNPLQYSCLGNPMDRGALLVIVLFSHSVVSNSLGPMD